LSKENYVTYFDSWFLPQGLALHSSLEKHGGDYTLWIICLDEKTHEILCQLNLSNIKLLKLAEVETDELINVKGGRSRVEYYWTLTPFAPRFVFEADPLIQRVTYLDADLWFRKSPEPIFLEFVTSGKEVLITDHSYAPEYDKSALSGQYCVQFMIFNRNGGEIVRKWWEERCLEWCFAHTEDNKFGDQKYLDDWPQRFSKYVHVLRNKEWALAPWNATRFPYGNCIFYHFHDLKLLNCQSACLGGYILPPVLMQNIYRPYLDCLRKIIDDLKIVNYVPKAQRKRLGIILLLKIKIAFIISHRWQFNIYKIMSLDL